MDILRRIKRRATNSTVLVEVTHELINQDDKWGEQNHPNGTGPMYLFWPAVASKSFTYGPLAEKAKQSTDNAATHGGLNYADIFVEEVFEALAEEDPQKLRAELIQCAAVAVAWVEKIDRDTAKKAE